MSKHPMFCGSCGKILPAIEDDKLAEALEGAPINCNSCMVKKFGQAYVDNVENNAEDGDDLLDDE